MQENLIPIPNMRTNSYFDAIEVQLRTHAFLSGKGRDILRHSAHGAHLESAVLRLLRDGESFYVARDLIPAISHAAASIPDSYVLDLARLPARNGFVFCPSGLISSGEFTFHGLGWYLDADDRAQTWKTIVFIVFLEASHNTLVMAHAIPWGATWSLGDFAAIDSEVISNWESKDTELPRRVRSFAASLFEFMHDRILVTQTKAAPRHMQRRIARQYGDSVQPVVRVIELRARDYQAIEHEGEPQHRDYSCQWIVRGHWRNQWYPSLGRHQPKWITPYVKGPEDKPLKTPRANVFAVVR